jgi:hypothetical protein
VRPDPRTTASRAYATRKALTVDNIAVLDYEHGNNEQSRDGQGPLEGAFPSLGARVHAESFDGRSPLPIGRPGGPL